MTQLVKKSRDESQKFVFNFPIDITFKSTNPYGCKYIVDPSNAEATFVQNTRMQRFNFF